MLGQAYSTHPIMKNYHNTVNKKTKKGTMKHSVGPLRRGDKSFFSLLEVRFLNARMSSNLRKIVMIKIVFTRN